MNDCVFCDIITRVEPATIVAEWPDAIAFLPLNPVVPDGGHILVVPLQHVADATEDPAVTAATIVRAARLAAEHEASNIITSIGKAATQSIFHLHIHVIRRAPGDQLMVPWGTSGNPHDPHSCKRAEQAEAEVARLRAANAADTDAYVAGLEQIHSDRDHWQNEAVAATERAEQAEAEIDRLRALIADEHGRLSVQIEHDTDTESGHDG